MMEDDVNCLDLLLAHLYNLISGAIDIVGYLLAKLVLVTYPIQWVNRGAERLLLCNWHCR